MQRGGGCKGVQRGGSSVNDYESRLKETKTQPK
jgi:hypothetical protein